MENKSFKPIMVVYSVFRDLSDYRIYYDLIILPNALAYIEIGRLPRVYKKRPALPRRVDIQILQIRKERYRKLYDDKLDELIRQGQAKLIDGEKIVGVVLRDTEIPIPPILWKPPPPGEEPKYTEKVLAIEVFLENEKRPLVFYTSTKLKEDIKKSLKQAGLYLRRDIVEEQTK